MPRRPARNTNPSTDAYDHSGGRVNLPPAGSGVAGDDIRAARQFQPEIREKDDEPRLNWMRGNNSSVDESKKHLSLHLSIREEINPAATIAALTEGSTQTSLEGMLYTHTGLPDDPNARYEWYSHQQDWRNRLIHGESEQVMASLLDREAMAGQVQMIYFDPPFGINYNSNFQPDATSTDVPNDNKRGRPGNDVRTVKAFRDTWHNMWHSYLDSIHAKLRLFRELLADSGSLFFQIGEKNMARCLLLCDEVFGARNRVAIITFRTGGSRTSRSLPLAASYLLWYAKNEPNHKYHQMYEEQGTEEKMRMVTFAGGVEFADGTSRSLTAKERQGDWRQLPKDSRLFSMSMPFSQGHSTSGRSEPWHWSVSHDGLDRMAEKNRFYQSDPQGALRWKRYFDQMPGREINNIWHETANPTDKRYVVQTADKILERCILMSTDPGDLVLDPTCGSATTAVAAEKWGRRWITIDCSPSAIIHARTRISMSHWDYYTIADTEEGLGAENEIRQSIGQSALTGEATVCGRAVHDPRNGFIYERVPYVSPAVLAEDKEDVTPPTKLVNRPHVTKKRNGRKLVRVASPFTVEGHTPTTYAGFKEQMEQAEGVPEGEELLPYADIDDEHTRRVVEQLRNPNSPILSTLGEQAIQVHSAEEWDNAQHLTHRITYTLRGDPSDMKPRTGGLVIIAEDAPCPHETLMQSANEARRLLPDCELVVVVAYDFDPEANTEMFDKVRVLRVRPHLDLLIDDLDEDTASEAFRMLGQPDIAVHDHDDDTVSVEVNGYDAYDPATNTTEHGEAEDIAVMMVDTEYDGVHFVARLIHFPSGKDDKLLKRLKKQLGRSVDEDKWEAMLSAETAPFPAPPQGRRVAVKIVTRGGSEMTQAVDTPTGPARPPSAEPDTKEEPVPEPDPMPAERQRLSDELGRLAHALADADHGPAAEVAERLRDQADKAETLGEIDALRAAGDGLHMAMFGLEELGG